MGRLIDMIGNQHTPSTPLQSLRYVDWWVVIIYLLMVVSGALSIYAASYDFDHASVFAFSEFSGKQFLWIGISFAVGFIILMLEARVFETYAYPIYLIVLIVLLVTIFIAPDTKGSRSWLVFGPISLQPAEFAKFATALALAKLFETYGFRLTDSRRNYAYALTIILLPLCLIIMQKETGSALVFLSLFFVLYREGMSGMVLLAALVAVTVFVLTVKYAGGLWLAIPQGHALVFILLMALMVALLVGYCHSIEAARGVLALFASTGIIVAVLAACGIVVNGYAFFLPVITVACGYTVFMMLRGRFGSAGSRAATVVGAVALSIIFMFSVNIVFDKALKPYQQKRIQVALGVVEDPRGDGYNVNQAIIAIGSGGVSGKGFLNGTQTKLRYVPEQHTDFIFCTVGEERGFIGAAAVLLAFLVLIYRIIVIAERQPTTFARVYAYCVASYFIMHLCINIGMVVGLCPVIGIPLPFFSYGGSSMLGFTILLFILLRLDSARRDRIS